MALYLQRFLGQLRAPSFLRVVRWSPGLAPHRPKVCLLLWVSAGSRDLHREPHFCFYKKNPLFRCRLKKPQLVGEPRLTLIQTPRVFRGFCKKTLCPLRHLRCFVVQRADLNQRADARGRIRNPSRSALAKTPDLGQVLLSRWRREIPPRFLGHRFFPSCAVGEFLDVTPLEADDEIVPIGPGDHFVQLTGRANRPTQ